MFVFINKLQYLFDLDGLTEASLSGLGGLLGPLTNLFSGVAELLFADKIEPLRAESGLLCLKILNLPLINFCSIFCYFQFSFIV